MDYHALAEQLMDLHVLLHQSPAGRQLEDLDRGTSLALGYLMAHHKMAHPQELGRGMAVSSARVAALLNHLEDQGLIRRTADPDDNRQTIVSLTAAGEERIRQRRAQAVALLAQLLERLGPEDAAAYLRLRKKLIEALPEA